jgi:hypothetical protein
MSLSVFTYNGLVREFECSSIDEVIEAIEMLQHYWTRDHSAYLVIVYFTIDDERKAIDRQFVGDTGGLVSLNFDSLRAFERTNTVPIRPSSNVPFPSTYYTMKDDPPGTMRAWPKDQKVNIECNPLVGLLTEWKEKSVEPCAGAEIGSLTK